MSKIKKSEIETLISLGKAESEVENMTSEDAKKLIEELTPAVTDPSTDAKPASKKPKFSFVGRLKGVTKGVIRSSHLMRGKVNIEFLLANPELYLRVEAKRYMKEYNRNKDNEIRGVYPLLRNFGITDVKEIELLINPKKEG